MNLSELHLRRRLTDHEPQLVAKKPDTPHAAVAIILRESGISPQVLLIRRTSKPHDPWSGHMAFPGGRQDATDRDLLHTAQRETLEEVGIDLAEHGEVLGRLDDVQAISRARPMDLVIVPHIFVLRRDVPLTLQESEVAEALWVPISPMGRGESDCTRPYEMAGRRLLLPGYQVGPHVVWGLTYRMLQLLFDLASA